METTDLITETGIPVQKNTLAGEGGVLEREVYPDFSIYEKGRDRVDVKGLPFDLVKQNDLGKAVELWLSREQDQTVTLNKGTHDSLRQFSMEYSLLRLNGGDPLLRFAKKDGIQFNFYDKLPSHFNGEENQNMAQYRPPENAVDFSMPHYFREKPQDGIYHNTLAHELGHACMRERKDGKIGLDVFFDSDFGKKWLRLVQMNAFLSDPMWQDVVDQKKKEQNIEYFWTETPLTQIYVRDQLDQLKEYRHSDKKKENRDFIAETFCRLLGRTSAKEGFFSYDHVPYMRDGIGMVFQMAAAYANADDASYKAICDIVKNTQMPPDISENIIQFFDIKSSVKTQQKKDGTVTVIDDVVNDWMTISAEQQFDDLSSLLISTSDSFANITQKMKSQIKEYKTLDQVFKDTDVMLKMYKLNQQIENNAETSEVKKGMSAVLARAAKRQEKVEAKQTTPPKFPLARLSDVKKR